MIQIESIEIRYFRSIYQLKFEKVTDLMVLAGRNDIGKSNILKALNLFFNNQTEWNTNLNFARDFSRSRLSEVRKETIKGRQYIQVAVGFLRGNRYQSSLPEHFTVTKTWYRDSSIPDISNSLGRQFKDGQVPTHNLDRALASLQRYLNTIRFEYIPAIKDTDFFSYMLGNLQDVIFMKRTKESTVATAIQGLNKTVEAEAKVLQEEFLKATNVAAEIRLPEHLDELFRAFAVATKSGDEEIPLSMRGDGIRSRFLPSLLHYIAQHSKLYYVWGFEEPENSLELSLATRLTTEILQVYSKTSQVLMTSHSPAFFGLKKDGSSVYRVFWNDQATAVSQIHPCTTPAKRSVLDILEDELGLMEFQEQIQQEYESKLAAIADHKIALKKMRGELLSATKAVLLTEGKWDVSIIREAWKRQHRRGICPFRIISCDTTPDDVARSSAGAGMLKTCLESVRPDEPISIGLFDRDGEGKMQWEALRSNFQKRRKWPDVKVQRTGTAATILLPVIRGRKDYDKVDNLPLELYFDDEYLRKKIRGKGLRFVQARIEKRLVGSGFKLGQVRATEPNLRHIKEETKKDFAELIVPSLPDEAFKSFRPLFALVKTITQELKKLRKRQTTILPDLKNETIGSST